MRRFVCDLGTVLLLISTLLIGCSTAIPPELEQARAHLEVVDSLDVQKQFPTEYQTARDKFLEAERFSQSTMTKGKVKDSAIESLNASKQILKEFYQTTITPLAKNAKKQIEEITAKDPDNPLQEFVPKIDELLEYSDKLELGVEIIALNKVLDDLEKVTVITHNLNPNLSTILDSDISFDTGKYELSDNGKEMLTKFFRKIIKEQQEYLSQFTGRSVSMKITVVGYTDQQGFQKGSKLAKLLIEGMEADLPENALEQRKFLNQRLSQFRANTIGEYIQQVISENDSNINVQLNIIGLGEELPRGVTPPYPASDSVSDPSRRICKVYSSVIVE